MITPCKTEEDYQMLVRESFRRPVLLMKHSTRCPISAAAHARYQQYAEQEHEADCWEVQVIEERQLSQRIAQECGVPHQSPQVILFVDGRAVWHTSHMSITRQSLESAVHGHRPRHTE